MNEADDRDEPAVDPKADLVQLREEIAALQAAVRARDDFISIAVHELRNPMTPLLGQISLLRKSAQRAGAKVSPGIARGIERLDVIVRRYMRRTTTLLDIARLTSGNFRLNLAVVDDEFGIGELLRDLLGDEGHEVALAINGRQGLALMAQKPPALVLLDYMMPVLDGAGVLKAMTADPTLSPIPVILMSSLPEAAIEKRAPGYTHYVRKPFRIDDIIRLTSAALTGRDSSAE